MEQFFENIFNYFSFLGNDMALFIVSMLPIVELRGAIPLGAIFNIGILKTFIISVVGNLVPVPFLICLARPIFNWLKSTKWLSKLTHKIEAHIMSKADKIMQYFAPAISAGVIEAGVLMTIVSFGVSSLVGLFR